MHTKQTENSVRVNQQYLAQKAAFFGFISAVFLLVSALPAQAAWNTPTCNPDDVDPTDPTCNVSAPLNVSDADQIKTGELEVHNTVSAEDLIISNSFSGTGNGTVSITTSAGDAVTVTQDDVTSRGVVITQSATSSAQALDIDGDSSDDAVNISQAGVGTAVEISHTTNSSEALRVDGGRTFLRTQPGNNAVLQIINNSNTTTTNPGSAIYARIQPGGITTGTHNPGGGQGLGANIQAYSSYGGYFYSEQADALRAYGGATGGNGIYANASVSGFSGVVGLNASGGSGYGGYFETKTSSTSGAALAAINNDANAHTTAQIYQGTITPASIPGGGAALDVQTDVGYGGYFLSTDASIGVGVIGTGIAGGVNGYTTTGAYGVFGSNTSSSGHGGYFTATGTSGVGVYATSTNSNGIYAEGGTNGVYGLAVNVGGAGVYGENSKSGSKSYGVQGMALSGGDGYGGYFEASGTGGDAGAARFINNTTNGNGIQVYTSGVTVSPLPVASAAIDAQTGNGIGINAETSDVGAFAVRGFGRGGGVVGLTGESTKIGVFGENTAPSGQGYGGRFRITSASSDGAAILATNPDNNGIYVGKFYAGGMATGSATLATIPTTGQTVLDVQSDVGHGVHAYTTEGDSAAIMGIADAGTVSYGGYFEASGVASSAVYVEQTNPSSGYGIELYHQSDTGIYVESNQGTSLEILQRLGTGIKVEVQAGASSNAGLEVDTSATAQVPSIVAAPDDFGVAVTTRNGGEIVSSGGFRGGQFYYRDHSSNTGRSSNAVELIDSVSIGGYDSGDNWAGGLAYALGDIWVGAGASITLQQGVTRVNADTALETIAYGRPGGLFVWHPSSLVQAGDKMYAFPTVSNTSVQYAELDLYSDDITMYALSSLSTTAPIISSATFDGTNIWIGTTGGVYTLTPGGTTLTAVSALSSSLVSNPTDMIYAAGHIWVLDQGDPTSSTYAGGSKLYKVSTGGTLESTIVVGDDAKKMVFDGGHIWTANEEEGSGGGDSISRVNIATEAVDEIDLDSSFGDVKDVAFDGANIWIAGDNAIQAYNIASERLGDEFATGTTYNDLLFDGTYLWGASATQLDKISVGAGQDAPNALITNGAIIKDASNGNLYCVYMNSGSLTSAVYDSTTSTPCNR